MGLADKPIEAKISSSSSAGAGFVARVPLGFGFPRPVICVGVPRIESGIEGSVATSTFMLVAFEDLSVGDPETGACAIPHRLVPLLVAEKANFCGEIPPEKPRLAIGALEGAAGTVGRKLKSAPAVAPKLAGDLAGANLLESAMPPFGTAAGLLFTAAISS